MDDTFINSKLLFITICIVIGFNFIISDNNIIIKKNIK